MTNDVPPTDGDRRPHSAARRIDAACDRFEVAWRGGQAPRIEDLLEVAAEAERPALFGSNPRANAAALEGCRDFAELLSLWAQRIERLAQNLHDGAAEVAPLPQACSSCHLQGLCRISTAAVEAEAEAEVQAEARHE